MFLEKVFNSSLLVYKENQAKDEKIRDIQNLKHRKIIEIKAAYGKEIQISYNLSIIAYAILASMYLLIIIHDFIKLCLNNKRCCKKDSPKIEMIKKKNSDDIKTLDINEIQITSHELIRKIDNEYFKLLKNSCEK